MLFRLPYKRNEAEVIHVLSETPEILSSEEPLDEAASSRRLFLSQMFLGGLVFVAQPMSAFAQPSRTILPTTGQEALKENPDMPLVRIDALEGRSDTEVKALLDAAHRAIVAALGVPLRDRYQVYQAHRKAHMVIQDTGLNIPRTDDFLLFTIFSKQRTEALKVKFYAELTRELQSKLSISPGDVMICFAENTGADWSFGNGVAQFLTGDLK